MRRRICHDISTSCFFTKTRISMISSIRYDIKHEAKEMANVTLKFHHYCQWVFHLSSTSSLSMILLQEEKHVLLSMMSTISRLARTSGICACPIAHRQCHHHGHFHTRAQTQLERAAAIRLTRFYFSNLDYVGREGIGW
jgi:hypothetical protein